MYYILNIVYKILVGYRALKQTSQYKRTANWFVRCIIYRKDGSTKKRMESQRYFTYAYKISRTKQRERKIYKKQTHKHIQHATIQRTEKLKINPSYDCLVCQKSMDGPQLSSTIGY